MVFFSRSLCSKQALSIDPDSATGGWNHDAHFKFKALLETYALQNRSRASLNDRLRLEFPHMSSSCIAAHRSWIEMRKKHDGQSRAIRKAFAEQKQDIVASARHSIESAEQLMKEARDREKENLSHEIRRDQIHRRLDQLQLEASERDASRRELQEYQERLSAEIRRLEHAHKEEERHEKRQLLEQYHRKKRELQIRAEQWRMAEELAEQERRELDGEYNTVRVRVRQEEFAEKQDSIRQAREAKEMQREAAMARLRALAISVAPEVAIDPNRVLQATISSGLHIDGNAYYNARAPLVNVSGYSDERLMEDPRFKLATVLREKGLHDTAYGLQAIMRAAPAQLPRLDAYTSKDSSFHMSAVRAQSGEANKW
jgi:hypothetical protein